MLNGVVELKIEHVLMLAIVLLILYHFMGRCNCFNNGFRVGGEEEVILNEDGCPDMSNCSGCDNVYQQMKTCYGYDEKRCKFKVSWPNKCRPEPPDKSPANCVKPMLESEFYLLGWEGWKNMNVDEQRDICENIYSKSAGRGLTCRLDVAMDHNECVSSSVEPRNPHWF